MRKVLLDAHTHTVASGHAYSSLQEMAKAAADMGLEVFLVRWHGGLSTDFSPCAVILSCDA